MSNSIPGSWSRGVGVKGQGGVSVARWGVLRSQYPVRNESRGQGPHGGRDMSEFTRGPGDPGGPGPPPDEGLSSAQITHPGGLLPGVAPAGLQHGSGPPQLLQALREIGRPRGGAVPPSLGKKRGTVPGSGSRPPPFYIITPEAQAPRHPGTYVHVCTCITCLSM